jgi:hypothetical protein
MSRLLGNPSAVKLFDPEMTLDPYERLGHRGKTRRMAAAGGDGDGDRAEKLSVQEW